MNHPHELLAEYVDGTLPQGERAVVDAHLRDCQQCRAEVGPAGTARRALASLPDGPVPAGIGDAALAEATGGAPGHSTAPRWYRYSGVAAAAVIVALLAVAIPRLGSDDDGAGGAQEAAAPAADADAAAPVPGAGLPAVDVESTDYSPETLVGLASAERSTIEATDGDTPAAAFGSGPREALDCLRTAFPPLEGRPVRLIRARFQGTAAYIGVFEANAGGDSPDRSALAAAVRDCRLLSYAPP